MSHYVYPSDRPSARRASLFDCPHDHVNFTKVSLFFLDYKRWRWSCSPPWHLSFSLATPAPTNICGEQQKQKASFRSWKPEKNMISTKVNSRKDKVGNESYVFRYDGIRGVGAVHDLLGKKVGGLIAISIVLNTRLNNISPFFIPQTLDWSILIAELVPLSTQKP